MLSSKCQEPCDFAARFKDDTRVFFVVVCFGFDLFFRSQKLVNPPPWPCSSGGGGGGGVIEYCPMRATSPLDSFCLSLSGSNATRKSTSMWFCNLVSAISREMKTKIHLTA